MRGRRHPYSNLTGSPQWTVIDRAVCELAENRDLVETTAHEYIVGYLCQALETTPKSRLDTRPHTKLRGGTRAEALQRIREAVKKANTSNRDLAQELIEERRLEAQSE